MNVTVVVDSEKKISELGTGWGLSIYIEKEDSRILFDTGPDPDLLINNSKKLGIDLSSIDLIVVSHAHSDHTGGLIAFKEIKPGIKVYYPYPCRIERLIESYGLTPIGVKETEEIVQRVYVVGPLPAASYGLWKQALAVKMKKYVHVFVGCSHPGVNEIVKRVSRDIKGRIGLVIGGFHGPSKQVLDELLDLKPIAISPIHCSGEHSVKYIEENFDGEIIRGGAGLKMIIDDKGVTVIE